MTATEKDVGALHKSVNTRLKREVDDPDSPVGWTQAAISFLKLNDCTMSGGQKSELQDLQERVDRRKQREKRFASNVHAIRPDVAVGDD